MIKVGITGGIGSGKSTICKIFQVLGVSVYFADVEARKLTDSHAEIVHGIKELFGEDIYIEGCLNRKKVASVVFKDSKILSRLNNIIHPVVAEHFEDWLVEHANERMVIKEAAILFESGGDKEVDKVITVVAPKDLRIKRVVERDNMTIEEVESRMQQQMTDQERLKRSDFVVNCNDVDLVIPQVLDLHKRMV